MKSFKEFIGERALNTWAKKDVSDLKAQLLDIEGQLDTLEEGPRKLRLHKRRLFIMEAIKQNGLATDRVDQVYVGIRAR